MENKKRIDDVAEDRINFFYALDMAAAMDDKEMLENSKKEYPEIYAEWEKMSKKTVA